MSKLFIELNYMADGHAEQAVNLAGLWQLIHAVAAEYKLKFSVAFPQWTDPVRGSNGEVLKAGTFGPTMRLFLESPEDAGVMHQQLSRHRMVRSGMVVASAIKAVPAHAAATHAFIRSRIAEKTTDGFFQREQRRQLNAAAQGKRQRDINMKRKRELHQQRPSNYVAMRSSSNGRPFGLRVERVPAEQRQQAVSNGYGLGVACPSF